MRGRHVGVLLYDCGELLHRLVIALFLRVSLPELHVGLRSASQPPRFWFPFTGTCHDSYSKE
jgi:hypothetical protein